jgi:hypothetical protein
VQLAGKVARKAARTGANSEANGGNLANDAETEVGENPAEIAENRGEMGELAMAGDARDRNRTCTPFGTGT